MSTDAPHSGPSGTSAVVSYVLLLVGFFAIGISTQTRSPIHGLWITEALAIALPALIALRGANVKALPWLGLGRIAPVAILAALGLALLNQPAIAFLEWGAQKAAPAPWVQLFLAKNVFLEQIFRRDQVWMVLTVTIAAPLGEELFFRGFLQPALARRMGIGPAIVLQGALFAAIHVDPIGFIGLWELGILFGILRHATGSLWPSIAAHAANNGIAAFAFLAGLQKPDEVPPPWLIVLGAALLAGLAVWTVLAARKPDPRPARPEPIDKAAPAGGFRIGRVYALALVWVASVGAGVALYVMQLR